MKNILPSPYPRLGEVIREITLAFDTKNASTKITATKMDEFASGEDINWFLAPKIIDRHIYQPIKSFTNEEFAQFIAGFTEYLTLSYVELVKNINVDNLMRHQVSPTLAEDYFAMQAFELISQMQVEFRGPPLRELFDHNGNMIKLILDWFHPQGSTTLHKLAYPSTTDTEKTERDNFIRWTNGQYIPDSTSLSRFVTSLSKNNTELEIGKLRVWLQFARAFAWFEKEFSEYPIRFWMMRFVKEPHYLPRIDLTLSKLVQIESKRIEPTLPLAFQVSTGLEPSAIKSVNAQEWLKEKLIEFEALLKVHDPDNTLGSFVEWNWGRWHVLAGEPEKAIPHYGLAFDLAHYRAGENQRKILKESLALAGYTADRPFLKRMKNHAISFGLLKAPENLESEVIEQWEYEQLARQFKVTFPKNGYFSGASEEDAFDEDLPFLLFDQETICTKKPDIRNPNRKIKVIAENGQVRRYPQLLFFASWGVTDAVKTLLDKGASVDLLDENNASPLLCSIQHAEQTGETAVLDILLKQTHKKSTLDKLTSKKQINPLFCAVEFGEPALVESLLKMGASADIKGNLDAKTALYTCMDQIAFALKPELLKELFVRSFRADWDLNQQDAMRRYGVNFAGVFGERNGLDLLLRDPRKEQIFLEASDAFIQKHLGAWSLPKLLRIVELLLEHGAQPNQSHSYPIQGMTPFMLSAEDDCLEAFQLMLRYGGNPYKEDSLGRNALQIAREFNSVKVLTYYLMGN